MQFALNDEQIALQDAVRDLLRTRAGDDTLRELLTHGRAFDRSTWDVMAKQLGLQGLPVPERYDGAGCGAVELAVVLEEMGRVLYSGPYLSTLLGVTALGAARDEEAMADLLPGVVSGDVVLALALTDVWPSSGPTVRTRAVRTSHGHRLTGAKRHVLDVGAATVLVVSADTEDGPGLFLVDAAASGLRRTEQPGLDLTREIGAVTLQDAPGRPLGRPGGARPVLAQVTGTGALLTAAEAVGGAAACLEASVRWAQERHQFGRPIGSFQALKHTLADVLVEVETARVLVQFAAYAVDADRADAELLVSMAKQQATGAFLLAAAQNVQVHGGIGFTWEHPAHLYLKRSRASAVLFGTTDHHQERIADLVGV